MRGRVAVVSRAGGAEGSRAAAAALACAVSSPQRAALLLELSDARRPRPALIASAAARALEERLAAHLSEAAVASRGWICHLALSADAEGLERAPAALALARDGLAVLHVSPPLLRPAVADPRVAARAVLLRADPRRERALVGLAVRDLLGRGLEVAVLKRPLAWVAARRALFGALERSAAGSLPPSVVARMTGEQASIGPLAKEVGERGGTPSREGP